MERLGKKTKLALGSIAVGAVLGIAAKRWRRRRAQRRREEGLRTVALFSLEPTAQTMDAPWEGLEGRALFKQLCANLALRGSPPTDVGDIEAGHECSVFVAGNPLYLRLVKDAGSASGGWALLVTTTLGTDRRPGKAPADTPELRAFLGALDEAIRAVAGARHLRWLLREDYR